MNQFFVKLMQTTQTTQQETLEKPQEEKVNPREYYDDSKSFLNKPVNPNLVCFGGHYMINNLFKGKTINGSLDLLFL